jgi:hypothetical protein
MDENAAFRHEVQFYSSDSALLESFTRFISSALKSQIAVVVLATKSHRENLVHRLSDEGFDVDSAIQRGMYISLDAVEMLSTIMVNGTPNRLRFFEGLRGVIESAAKATMSEHPRVAICGECVGVLCAEGNVNAAIQLEEVGNDLILCAYPLSSFHGEHAETYQRICAQHTAVYSS